jgi:hypothetical protein
MYLAALQSDQFYTWSDEYPEGTHCRFAETSQDSSAPISPAPSHPARLPYRALQTLWQAGMQMRRRPRPWPQVLSVGKLPGLAAANGLRAPGVVCANGGVRRQLPPNPRDSGGNLPDQPRTTAPSRGALKGGRRERIPGCPPSPNRCRIGRRAPRQYARKLARRRPKGFTNRGGIR